MRVRRHDQNALQESAKKSIYAGEKSGLWKKQNGNGSVIQASQQNSSSGIIGEKKASAQRLAFRIVKNAFSSDQKMDDQEKALQERVSTLRDEIGQAGDTIRQNKDKIEALQKNDQVDPDSQEQSDLNLLMKQKDIQSGASNGSLSADENKRIGEIEKQGLTGYQQQALQIYDGNALPQTIINNDTNEIMGSVSTLKGIKLARLGSQVMTDARQQSDDILTDAGKEAVGTLMSAAKDHLDEDQKKAEEKAKEKQEQDQKQQAGVDAAKADTDRIENSIQKAKENADESRGSQEAASKSDGSAAQPAEQSTTDSSENAAVEIPSLQNIQDDIKRKVDDMLTKMKLTGEDIKGAAVDEKK
jgi:DNA-binding protein H-NS